MWGSKKDSRNEAGITLIANNCEVIGDVCFSDQLLVNGVIKGNVYAREGASASLTVSESGEVHGDIRVPNIIINGTVVGDIHSDGHIELAAEARIQGNVYYTLIEMVIGSRVDGSLVHVSEKTGHTGAVKVTEAPRTNQPGSDSQANTLGAEPV
jgi:cytoskeletal protein CcmA (bactofilin family)